MKSLLVSALALTTLLAAPAYATTVTDDAGDFVSTFTGDKLNSANLDILSFSVEKVGSSFNISATMAGEIGGKGGAYVLGINRGGATNHPFVASGQPNVSFDQSFSIRDNGDVFLSGVKQGFTFTIADDSVSHTGSFFGTLSNLQSTGFEPRDFQFALWSQGPAALTGRNADFAPGENNRMITAVPEPSAWALMLVGFGATGSLLRSARRRNRLVLG